MRGRVRLKVLVAGERGVHARHFAIDLALAEPREISKPYVHVARPESAAAAAPTRFRK